MADSPLLSVILSYRNRDLERVRRCLDSLANQTMKDFEVLFVDYGSSFAMSRAIRSLVEQYPFIRYLYSDTRGQPWNRSRALNIGIRNARGGYILTNDIDMILAPNGLERLYQQASLQTVLHLRPIMLPEDFTDWEHVCDYEGKFPLNSESGLGIACLAAEHWQHLRGFDEFYRYYGVEDRDLRQRLAQLGVGMQWVHETVSLFHQWHPTENYLIRGFMPDQVWIRMNLHYHQERDTLERNMPGQWGEIVDSEQRAVLAYVDPEQHGLMESERLHHFYDDPLSTQSVSTMIQQFFDLPAGHAFAVHHDDGLKRSPVVDALAALANKWLRRKRNKDQLVYRPNLVYDTVHYLIEQTAEYVADYYLDANGVSVLVKGDGRRVTPGSDS